MTMRMSVLLMKSLSRKLSLECMERKEVDQPFEVILRVSFLHFVYLFCMF